MKSEKFKDPAELFDGYHTMQELYEHRIALYIALCKKVDGVWRSKFHSDGSSIEGWFIMGIDVEPEKQISYHLPMDKWDATDFAKTLEIAPDWDGHTPGDVLKRLARL